MKQLQIINCILFQENSDNNDLLRLFLALFFSYRAEAQWASQGPRTESKWQRPTEKSTDGEKTVREREEWDNSWMHKERQMKKKRICCGRSVRGGSHGEDEEWGRSAVGSHVPTRETSGNLICCHSQCLLPPVTGESVHVWRREWDKLNDINVRNDEINLFLNVVVFVCNIMVVSQLMCCKFSKESGGSSISVTISGITQRVSATVCLAYRRES